MCGGVTQHILGIQRFSRHKVRAVPSKFARLVLSKTGLTRYLYQRLMNKIGLNGYDVVHSHVNPWFTNLCLSSRANTCKWIHTYHTLYFDEDYSDGLQSWQKEINRTLIEIASKADVGISVSKWLLFPHHCMCSWCPWQAYYRPAFWLCLSPSSGTSMVSTPGAVASSICKVLGKGITMRGKTIISVIAASVSLAINIPLNMSLGPRMGITEQL